MIRKFLQETTGTSAIEYGLIASLIAVAVIGVLVAFGPNLVDVFLKVKSNL